MNREDSQGRNLALCSFQLLAGNAFSFCKVIPPLPLKNLPKRKHRALSLKPCADHLYFTVWENGLKRLSRRATVGGEGTDSEREQVDFTLPYRPQGYICFLTEKLLKVSKTFFSSLLKSRKLCIYRTDVLCYKFFTPY